MSLPINITDLIHGKSIEWERLEFKKGWNPEEVAHTLCAFANDLNNWGGGYIIIGIDENQGQLILPPTGLQQDQLDKIQGEVLLLANQIMPNYYPIMQPYQLQGKQILVLWCPAGDNRPYTALSTQGQKGQRYPYIRFGSRSIIAKGENLRRLHELAARIPFDDRVNNRSVVADFDLGLIQAFLQEVKSELYEESKHISLNDLVRQMHIAKGPDEDLRPVNVGLLFFSRQPDLFFPRSWIELVWHKGDADDSFSEVYFKGPIHVQLRAAMAFLSNNIIAEKTTKIDGKAEAERYYNFPYKAVEEALSNAVYHKSYELGAPIEVQIWPDKIEILSFPGPVPPVEVQILKQQKRIVARDYRNRRIGDFLKEIHLTEGRGTGFPAIYKAMANNNSPDPVFETNEQCTYFLTTLGVNSVFAALDSVTNDERKDLKNDVATVNNEGAIGNNEGTTADNGGTIVNNEGAIVENEGAKLKNGRAVDKIGGVIEETFKGETRIIKTKLITLLISIENKAGMRSPDYIISTGLSESSIERYIKLLREAGLIEFKGAAPQTGGYYLTEKMNRELEK